MKFKNKCIRILLVLMTLFSCSLSYADDWDDGWDDDDGWSDDGGWDDDDDWWDDDDDYDLLDDDDDWWGDDDDWWDDDGGDFDGWDIEDFEDYFEDLSEDYDFDFEVYTDVDDYMDDHGDDWDVEHHSDYYSDAGYDQYLNEGACHGTCNGIEGHAPHQIGDDYNGGHYVQWDEYTYNPQNNYDNWILSDEIDSFDVEMQQDYDDFLNGASQDGGDDAYGSSGYESNSSSSTNYSNPYYNNYNLTNSGIYDPLFGDNHSWFFDPFNINNIEVFDPSTASNDPSENEDEPKKEEDETEKEPTLFVYYLDKDGDGFHSQEKEAEESPGSGWSLSTKGDDCDDGDSSKWKKFNKSNFFEAKSETSIGVGGPVTPSTPSKTDDFVFGGGNSGIPEIQPVNLEAFAMAQSGEMNLNGLNPFSDDVFWVTENLLEKTEEELFDYFEDALELLTMGSQANAALNDLMNHFKNNSGDYFMNDKLSDIIKFGDGNSSTDRTVEDFMISLFDEICTKLNELDGECIGDKDTSLDITPLKYPNFPLSDPNLIAQLGGIQGAGAFIDGNGNLTAELYDTFGVSEEDAVKRDGLFGNTISGGSIGTKAMRILQTHFGKKPFVHGVKIDPLKLGKTGFNLKDCN